MKMKFLFTMYIITYSNIQVMRIMEVITKDKMP